jgi:hypothetical protein
VWSAIELLPDLVQFAPQAENFLVFLKQHGQQKRFKRQDVRGIRSGGEMLAGGNEKIVQGLLVLLAQSASETRESSLFFVKYLRNG